MDNNRLVDYNHPVHGFFAQYGRSQAGYYRGARRQRRASEIRAWECGVQQHPAQFVDSGAPGLLGACGNDPAEVARRRAAAYGPYKLP